MHDNEVPMTEKDDWDKKMPPWLSMKTFKVAAALKMRAEDAGVNLGIPMKAQRNGDSMWYMLTDGVRSVATVNGESREIQHLTVLLCTPYGIFIEDNYRGDEVEYGILSDPDVFIEHLKNGGMRCLSDEEFKRFINGTL